MSTSSEPGTAVDTPFAPAPASDDPRRGKEVYAPANGPFEAPAKEMVPGPYYVGIEERMPELAEREPEAASKGPATYPVDRRDFMKLFSATTVAATAACVQRPVELAIPYVNQPIDQYPGESVWYATTCGDCTAGCGVMVRTREGRPVKVEGLPGHKVNEGAICAVGQGSLQGLWHPERQKGAKVRIGNRLEAASWAEVYEHLATKMGSGKIGILTGGATGHRHQFFKEFLDRVGAGAARLYTFEPNTLLESMVAAHKIAFGVDALPRTDLAQARTIVGIGADFLDVGTSLVHDTKGYTKSHAFADGKKGRHVQFEAAFTLTGARCDERIVIPPGTETLTTLLLVRALLDNKASKGSGASRAQIQQVLEQKGDLVSTGYDRIGVKRDAFDKLAGELLAEQSVVMAGGSYSFDENATNLQLAAIMANELLGAYDTVLHLQKGWRPAPVVPGDLQRFLADAPGLDVVFVIDSNPVFSLPPSWGVTDVLKKIPTLVSIQEFQNETDEIASYQLSGHHWLEAWGDEQPVAGYWTVRQPSVRPTTDSQQAEDVLLWLAATLKKSMGHQDYRSYLRKKWSALQQVAGSSGNPDAFFDAALRAGAIGQEASQAVGGMSGSLAASFKYVDTARGGLRLIAPLDFRLRDGKHAQKPVLQEAADTLTTVTWDTFLAINPTTALNYGFKKFDVVKVEGPAGTFEASIYPLPGLHPDAIVVPRGNGHAKGTGTIQGGNGVNPLLVVAKAVDAITGAPVITGQAIKLTPTGRIFQMAQLQKHNDIANRKDIVKKVSLAKAVAGKDHKRDLDSAPDMYPALPKLEYRWGMAIDLDKCTGCQACYVACTLENNVSMVGREQILMGREMNWIKIDRYFWGNPDNPEVTLQPMLCQHCNHAPCEAVCPMYATTHDPEGINAMTYNRCIGTKYCANACPYKIRRFNWWTHKWNVMGERLQDRSPRALNPDVTVRTRGVMEKCTFCYQRIRDAKHKAKLEGRLTRDGEIQPACAQTCPADAISFGNLHDPNARVAGERTDNRAYTALNGDPEHGHYGLKTIPNVSYLSKVNLIEMEVDDGHGAKPH